MIEHICGAWNFTLIYFMGRCNTCSTRLQSYSRFMTCSVCSECYHLKCLPNIDTSDSVYLDRDSLPWICVICSGSIFPFNQCDDDCDFLETISELWDIKPIASFSNFRDRTFLPWIATVLIKLMKSTLILTCTALFMTPAFRLVIIILKTPTMLCVLVMWFVNRNCL